MPLLVPFQPMIGGGGVITAISSPNQALYWELVSYDPATETEGEPLGSLRYNHTRANQAGLSVNLYQSPINSDLSGQIDRVKVRWTNA